MARAKRTQRTDARRRHRAEQAALAGETIEMTDPGDARAPQKAASTAKPAQGQRPGFTTLMREAYRSPNIIEDLKSLPLVLINPGFLLAVGGSVAIAIWFVLSYNPAVNQVPVGDTEGLAAVSQSYQLPALLMGMVISPPPAVGAFIIGFMAKRASWLGGLLYGIVCSLIVVAVLQQPAGRLFTGDASSDALLVQTAAWSPVGAALFAAAAAWYKRFLSLSNPNRSRAEQEKKKTVQKPQGRGNVKTNSRSSSR